MSTVRENRMRWTGSYVPCITKQGTVAAKITEIGGGDDERNQRIFYRLTQKRKNGTVYLKDGSHIGINGESVDERTILLKRIPIGYSSVYSPQLKLRIPVYISRYPARQYRRGLTPENCYLQIPATDFLWMTSGRQHTDYWPEIFYNLINNRDHAEEFAKAYFLVSKGARPYVILNSTICVGVNDYSAHPVLFYRQNPVAELLGPEPENLRFNRETSHLSERVMEALV